MRNFDAVIVGGGPAGSTCGGLLHAAGMNVLLVDKREFPRDKTCAGWITPPIVETLGLDIEEYSRQATCQPITAFRTGMIGGKAVATDYGRVVSYGIRRCEFDHYLLKRSGVATELGVPVKSLEFKDSRWIINDDITTPLLIGAGGHFCPVARHLGARDLPGSTVVAAQEIEFEMAADDIAHCDVQPHQPELYFCDDLAGYGWCFRKRNFINIGLGRTSAEHVSDHVEKFQEYLRQTGRYTGSYPGKFHGHAYQLYERDVPRLFDDGVVLVGDAAGLAYPQSGEGIRPAIESAVLAAETILAANGEYGRSQLSAYHTRLIDRLGTPRKTGRHNWLPHRWLCHIAGGLLGTKWFAKNVVIDKWFLHKDTAALEVNHERHRVQKAASP